MQISCSGAVCTSFGYTRSVAHSFHVACQTKKGKPRNRTNRIMSLVCKLFAIFGQKKKKETWIFFLFSLLETLSSSFSSCTKFSWLRSKTWTIFLTLPPYRRCLFHLWIFTFILTLYDSNSDCTTTPLPLPPFPKQPKCNDAKWTR